MPRAAPLALRSALFTLGFVAAGCTDSSTAPHDPDPPPAILTLAVIDGGGAAYLDLSGGRVYFTDYNQYEIHSVPVAGGVIATHFFSAQYTFGPIVRAGGRIYTGQPVFAASDIT